MCAFSYALSLPVTWQRWWSHQSIRRIRIPHVACKPHGCMFYETGVMSDRIRHCGNRNFQPFAPVTFTFNRWPLYTNLTRIPWKYTGCANMNFLRQSFRKLSSDRRTYNKYIQTRPRLYTTPLRGWSVRSNVTATLYYRITAALRYAMCCKILSHYSMLDDYDNLYLP